MIPYPIWRLQLNARQCVSCGICMDVCGPRAIAMRMWNGRTIDGAIHDARLGTSVRRAMTFPYLAAPRLCDGCLECIRECPTAALALEFAGGPYESETLDGKPSRVDCNKRADLAGGPGHDARERTGTAGSCGAV